MRIIYKHVIVCVNGKSDDMGKMLRVAGDWIAVLAYAQSLSTHKAWEITLLLPRAFASLLGSLTHTAVQIAESD